MNAAHGSTAQTTSYKTEYSQVGVRCCVFGFCILKEKLGNISVLHSQPKVENILSLFAAWKTLSSSSRDSNPKGAKFHNYMTFTAL